MSLLQMSVSAGLMILITAVIRVLAINRLSKKIFSGMWGIILIRLLVPFSWPSSLNVSPFVSPKQIGPAVSNPSVTALPLSPSAGILTGSNAGTFPWIWIWGIGAALCAFYFIIAYFRCRREFRDSQLIECSFTVSWLEEHKAKRRIAIRQADGVSAPLSYGIFHPVILMPAQTDWSETDRLGYILTHEYVHIRRFDGAVKLFLTAALCVHWFNPFVWAMFLLANRDMELSCDEKVLQLIGEHKRSAYALTLISMAEKKNRFTPLCNNFSKNAMEERIESIMKKKKTTIFTLPAAILLIGSVTAVFAASAIKNEPAAANFASEGEPAHASAAAESETAHASAAAVEGGPAPASTAAAKSEPAAMTAQMSGADAKGGEIHNTLRYDTVEVRHYTDGGAPYVFWQRTNHTAKSIAQIQFGMLAFDEKGNALKLPWTVIDSSSEASYDVLCEWEPQDLDPDRQADSSDGFREGGWSLGWSIDIYEKDTPELAELFEKVAYVLCCDKMIQFEDGSTWSNPDYDAWLETYKGKATAVSVLQDYYPMDQEYFPA